MENRESIEQIFDKTENIYKAKKSIFLSIIFIIAGVALLIISPKLSETGILSPLSMVAGIVFLAWGVITIFFRKTYYISAHNKQKVSFSEILFDVKERERLIRLVNENNFSELKHLERSVNDALKLRVATTPDGNVCCTQVITYVPFEFVTANDVRSHSVEEARIIREIQRGQK